MVPNEPVDARQTPHNSLIETLQYDGRSIFCISLVRKPADDEQVGRIQVG